MTDPTSSFTPIRLHEVLRQCRADVLRMDPRYTIELAGLDGVAVQLEVNGIGMLLHSLFSSLMENACKYSSDHAAHVELVIRGDELVVVVEDKGIGIAPEDHDRVFKPFSGSRKGHGIGLAVARRIADLHKGRITLESSIGLGARFATYLPRMQ